MQALHLYLSKGEVIMSKSYDPGIRIEMHTADGSESRVTDLATGQSTVVDNAMELVAEAVADVNGERK